MARGIFVTGTGTDVGKTFVSALMIKHLRQSGLNAGYFKAAASGVVDEDGESVAEDALYICKAAGLTVHPNILVPYRYRTPVSPHLAAQLEGHPMELSVVKDAFDKVCQEFDFVVAEGSGGLVCPLRYDTQIILLEDIIKLFGLELVIVAAAGLGTINATVLTVQYAKAHGLPIKGIVLNHYDPRNPLHVDNQKMIEALTDVPILDCISADATDINLGNLIG